MEVDPRDDDGWTPLHAAVYWGCMDAAELLILSGANIFLKTNNVRGGREEGREEGGAGMSQYLTSAV